MKVIIADDEKKVCQLIYDLADWESFHMKVVGMAHNGNDTLEMIRQYDPDLIITDIKMPGCNGLEMIERARKIKPDMEFIIISGYRSFEYAQSAIKYGVSDYLLKPIQKKELINNLRIMQEKYEKKQAQYTEEERIRRQMKENMQRIRENFIPDYMREKKLSALSGNLQSLNERYCLNFCDAASFLIMIVKLDYNWGEQSAKGVELISSKAAYIIEHALRTDSIEMECCPVSSSVVCIVNFEANREKNIKKNCRQAFDTIKVQKSMFPQFTFSCGISAVKKSAEVLDEALEEATEAVKDRLVKGAGSFIEYRTQMERGNSSQNELIELLEENQKRMVNAITGQDAQNLSGSLRALEQKLPSTITGAQVQRLVTRLWEDFQDGLKEQGYSQAIISKYDNAFHRQEEICSSQSELFGFLRKKAAECMAEAIEQKKEEGIKPVRLAKEYIRKHYMEPLTLEEMGQITGYRASYFSALFKKETGSNFLEYLAAVRMDKAKELLKETTDSMLIICEKVGYSDVKHFTKTFKKETGLKPSEYRKLYS